MIYAQDELIDIYDMWYEPFWIQRWFVVIVCIVSILSIGFLLYFLYKKYFKKESSIDCSVDAYEGLSALESMSIQTQQDSKDLYFELSSIIKQYLACRYDTVFTQLTDKEIVRRVEDYISDTDVCILRKLLQSIAHVKFERGQVALEKIKYDIQLVKEFIQNTTFELETKEN